MTAKRSQNIRVGLFIFLAFLLFVSSILILGRKRNMFQQNIRISTVFKDVRGLRVGSNVRFTGIDVGVVTNISILSDTAVAVTLSIQKNVTPFIKNDSRSTIGTEGIMGSTLVILLPGTPDSESIQAGDRLASLEPVDLDDIVAEIKNSSEKISRVADNLIGITEKIKRGDGIFGKLFTDSELTAEIDRTGENVQQISENLKELSDKINSGEGLLGKVLMDTAFAGKVEISSERVAQVSSNLEEMTRNINKGQGLLGQLLADTTAKEGISKINHDLEKTVANLADVTAKLNNRNNALNKLIADPAFADSVDIMMQNLNRAIIEVTEASEELQRNTLIRMFSKDKDKIRRQEERRQRRRQN